MIEDNVALRRRTILIRAIPLVTILLSIISFRGEIRNIPLLYTGTQQQIAEGFRSLLVVEFVIASFVVFFVIWLLLAAAQALMPVRGIWEFLLSALYFFLYILRLHGPAVAVKGGRLRGTPEELHRALPGLAVIDYDSAMVLEETVPPTGCLLFPAVLLRTLFILLKRLSRRLGLDIPDVRVRGPGVTFIWPDERIRGVNDLRDDDPMERIIGVVDLRNQFRISRQQSGDSTDLWSDGKSANVFAYTRDGIEVSTIVWAVFTIGQETAPYFPLDITCIGEWNLRNLRIVTLRRVSNEADVYKVQALSDELDGDDCKEIHQFGQWAAARPESLSSYEPPPDHPRPPVFNSERVFAAVFARARHRFGGEEITDEIIPWFDLPVRVAVDIFRERLSHINYDELYKEDASGELLINRLREKLGVVVRNTGQLSCRIVFHRHGVPLREGEYYRAVDLRTTSEIRTLSTPKVLRDRGIRVITAGFGDLIVDERVYRQRLDTWRAAWERDTAIVQAGFDLEATRVCNRARIQAQRELAHSLSQIFQNNEHSKEVLAVRVLQALESLAADPNTQRLLPADTISLLRTIHDWLLPGDLGFLGSSLQSTDS